SLYFIAQKENLFAKHGLEVKIVDMTTTAAVQAMLGGSMQLTLGAGPAFTTATLEGSPPFVVISSWVNVFPYMVVARKEIAKIQDLKAKRVKWERPLDRRRMSRYGLVCRKWD